MGHLELSLSTRAVFFTHPILGTGCPVPKPSKRCLRSRPGLAQAEEHPKAMKPRMIPTSRHKVGTVFLLYYHNAIRDGGNLETSRSALYPNNYKSIRILGDARCTPSPVSNHTYSLHPLNSNKL